MVTPSTTLVSTFAPLSRHSIIYNFGVDARGESLYKYVCLMIIIHRVTRNGKGSSFERKISYPSPHNRAERCVMTKQLRHETILRVVRQKAVANQQALQQELARAGISATQATLSRDLTELGLVKTSEGYKLPAQIGELPHASNTELRRMLREFMREATPANNLVVVKTPVGSANALGIALDKASLPEVVGTVAGDDTILVVTRSAATARSLRRKFMNLVQ